MSTIFTLWNIGDIDHLAIRAIQGTYMIGNDIAVKQTTT